jgi:hypothetical protein
MARRSGEPSLMDITTRPSSWSSSQTTQPFGARYAAAVVTSESAAGKDGAVYAADGS